MLDMKHAHLHDMNIVVASVHFFVCVVCGGVFGVRVVKLTDGIE